MDLTRYQGVIKMVLAETQGRSPDEIYLELQRSMKIAAMIAGETTAPAQNIADYYYQANAARSQAPAPVLPMPVNKPGPVLVSAAPPVADAGESEESGDVDYWESKPGKGDGCTRLETAIKKALPSSIKVQLPGFPEPLELVLGVGGPGIKFVNVSYTIPGDSMGPRFVLMTSQKDFDKDAIVSDIIQQAGACYSKEKRVIVPKAPPPSPMPTSQDMQRMLNQDRQRLQGDPNDGLSGDEAMRARDDAKQWSNSRPAQWRE